jgi:hypothetical protein
MQGLENCAALETLKLDHNPIAQLSPSIVSFKYTYITSPHHVTACHSKFPYIFSTKCLEEKGLREVSGGCGRVINPHHPPHPPSIPLHPLPSSHSPHPPFIPSSPILPQLFLSSFPGVVLFIKCEKYLGYVLNLHALIP